MVKIDIMRKKAGLIFIFAFLAIGASAQSLPIEKTRKIIASIIAQSFPELRAAKINVKNLESDSDYFRSRFSFAKYLTFQKLTYTIFVNPGVYGLNAPEEGIEAILAHELAHILYYRRKNRLQLIGLANLASKGFTAQFERKTDMEAISRGYGEGLIAYRKWLYQNIPARNLEEKKRSYFSPEEIAEIMKRKEKWDIWKKKAPRSLEEIVK